MKGETVNLYKITTPDGCPCHGGSGTWNLPHDGQPGEWREAKGKLVPCENGLHLVRGSQLLRWLPNQESRLWLAETDGPVIDHGDKFVARKVRLVREIDTYNARTLRLFACDCAERALAAWIKSAPDDARPAEAIAVARRFANGEATSDELSAARSAAWSAAESAVALCDALGIEA